MKIIALLSKVYIPTRQSTLHGVSVHPFRSFSARVLSSCSVHRNKCTPRPCSAVCTNSSVITIIAKCIVKVFCDDRELYELQFPIFCKKKTKNLLSKQLQYRTDFRIMRTQKGNRCLYV